MQSGCKPLGLIWLTVDPIFEYGSRPGGIFNVFIFNFNFFFGNLFYLSTLPLRNCGRQEEPAILISRSQLLESRLNYPPIKFLILRITNQGIKARS